MHLRLRHRPLSITSPEERAAVPVPRGAKELRSHLPRTGAPVRGPKLPCGSLVPPAGLPLLPHLGHRLLRALRLRRRVRRASVEPTRPSASWRFGPRPFRGPAAPLWSSWSCALQKGTCTSQTCRASHGCCPLGPGLVARSRSPAESFSARASREPGGRLIFRSLSQSLSWVSRRCWRRPFRSHLEGGEAAALRPLVAAAEGEDQEAAGPTAALGSMGLPLSFTPGG